MFLAVLHHTLITGFLKRKGNNKKRSNKGESSVAPPSATTTQQPETKRSRSKRTIRGERKRHLCLWTGTAWLELLLSGSSGRRLRCALCHDVKGKWEKVEKWEEEGQA